MNIVFVSWTSLFKIKYDGVCVTKATQKIKYHCKKDVIVFIYSFHLLTQKVLFKECMCVHRFWASLHVIVVSYIISMSSTKSSYVCFNKSVFHYVINSKWIQYVLWRSKKAFYVLSIKRVKRVEIICKTSKRQFMKLKRILKTFESSQRV